MKEENISPLRYYTIKQTEKVRSFVGNKNLIVDFNKNQFNDYDIDFGSDEIEISAIISELILNEMKLQYICKSECKGLCTECGKNQNLAICKHPKKI